MTVTIKIKRSPPEKTHIHLLLCKLHVHKVRLEAKTDSGIGCEAKGVCCSCVGLSQSSRLLGMALWFGNLLLDYPLP